MLLIERQNDIVEMTLNRPEVCNALNEELIAKITETLTTLAKDEKLQALVIKASGNTFSAGADLNWMQKMVNFSEEENYQDALKLADMFSKLYHFPAPTIVIVQGAAYGGGVGLMACCDIAVASITAKFCFSEAKLGLIPSTISPYIYNRMGRQVATHYFLTAEAFSAEQGLQYHLIDVLVSNAELESIVSQKLEAILSNGSQAVRAVKRLRNKLCPLMDQELFDFTAREIARLRVSEEAQYRIKNFINKAG